ncbi:MAG: hypothetical protein M3394_04505 [Actinomycetota bacterium]|nr:hypothetical protein [Actinomycetota bacterium]
MANELLDLIDADPAVVHGQARFRSTQSPSATREVDTVADALTTFLGNDALGDLRGCIVIVRFRYGPEAGT